MSSGNCRKAMEFYLNLPYPVTVHAAAEGGFVAEVQELPGCMTEGETVEEVMELIEDARRSWIEATYNVGGDIPLPRTMEKHSGRFLVRLPKYVHRRLAQAAEKEGVSLNQYVASLLSSRSSVEELSRKLDDLSRCMHSIQQSMWMSLSYAPEAGQVQIVGMQAMGLSFGLPLSEEQALRSPAALPAPSSQYAVAT